VTLPSFSGPYAELPALTDPAYGGLGPYASSPLRDVVSTRINPDAYDEWYSSAEKIEQILVPEGSKLSCYHSHLGDELSATEGFDPRLQLRQHRASLWPLSGIIPMLVPGARGKLPFAVPAGTYVIAYSQLVRHPGGTLEDDGAIVRLKESMPQGSSLLLTFHGHYEHLLGAWMQGHPGEADGFWDQPFLAHFDAVIIDNFNPFSNSPRPSILEAERMHQMFMEDGGAMGRNVIPALAWADEPSLRRQVELFVSNPHLNTVYVDAYGPQVDRQTWSWRWLMAMERYVAPHEHVRWLIGGLSSAWHLQELHRIFPAGNFSLVLSRNHFVHAQSGTASRAIQAGKFEASLARLEDLRTGRETATRMPRPDHWPTYAEALRAHEEAYFAVAKLPGGKTCRSRSRRFSRPSPPAPCLAAR
jgi:hypothetical protein